jgi:4-amino-4-deoxy-L-arabinose transferase-like glycosyltransferase
LRLFDAVLGGLTVVIGYAAARYIMRLGIAAAVPLTLVGIPMFTAVSAALSADPLANLLSAITVLLLVRRLACAVHRSTDDRWALLTGASIGLGVLTKLAVGVFFPLALSVVVVRSTRVVREAAITLVAAAVLVIPWLVHQVTTYGWSDPLALARHAQVVTDQPRFPGLSPSYVGDFLTVTFHSFWAQFGWMAIVAPFRLYVVWGVVAALALIGLVLGRTCIAAPVWRLMLAIVALMFVAYVAYNLTFEQFQGRYLFPAIVPIAILLVMGWTVWLPERLRAPSALVISVCLVGLNAYALMRVLVPGFAPAP